MRLYHICSKAEWDDRDDSTYTPKNYESDGFVHLSRSFQLKKTYEAYYSGRNDLLLLEIKLELDDSRLIYEFIAARNDALPHYYAPISLHSISKIIHLPPEKENCFALFSEID
jgi:uncharacterized protein (DUF952 family)